MRPAGDRSRRLAALCLAILLCSAPAGAQESAPDGPLTKAGLLRQLVFGELSETELASEVRRRCLSFEPTATDIEDLRQVGATDPVVAAVESCTRSQTSPRTAAPIGEAPPRDAGPPAQDPTPASDGARPVEAVFEPESLVVIESAGTRSVRVLVREGDGNPTDGMAVSLGFSGDPDGSSLIQTTDERGVAIFQVSVSRLRNEEDLLLVAESRTLARLPVRVVPPNEVGLEFIAGLDQQATPGEWLPVPVVLEVRDAEGRPLPSQPVLFSAERGEVNPSGTVTDEEGRARVSVRPAAGAPETRLLAMVGPLSAEAALLGERAEAAALGAEVDVPPAPGAQTDVAAGTRTDVADRPANSPEEAATGAVALGYRQLESGELEEAERAFAAALAEDPSDPSVLHGLGLVELARGRTAEAEAQLEEAVRIAPEDAEAWADLGRARAAARDPAAAEQALYISRSLDPENEDTRESIRRLKRLRPWARFGGLGGATFQPDTSSGAIAVGLTLYPTPSIQLWGLYEDGLELIEPMLVRGSDAFKSIWGGISGDWGPEGRLRTSGGFGRRDAGEEFVENVYHLAQSISVPRAGRPVLIEFGGYLGRWFDRDDWIGYAELGVPLGVRFTLRPSFRFGETIGTNISESGRRAEKDIRGYIGLDYLGRAGWRIEPMVGFGSVSADESAVSADAGDLGGSILDATLLLAAPLGRVATFDVFVRYQRPPVTEAFTVVSAGLTFGVPRAIR
jgi:hypothetical protein